MKWESLIESATNKGVYVLTLAIEAGILYRFYWSVESQYYSAADYYLQLCIIGVADSVIFVALWRATYDDCGRLSPATSNESDKGKNLCAKCNAERTNYTVHHCRRCRACIDHMDHHCTFLAQCVGKNNIKYFLQFCLYIGFLLLYGIIKLFWFFYTQNSVRGVGVQGFTWIYVPTPLSFPYIFFFSEDNGGYPLLRTADNYLLLVCLAFCIFALTMGFGVLINLYRNISEIDKVKKDQAAF